MPISFQYVWQYSNSTIQVLAADIAQLIPGAAGANSDKFIPISNGTNFLDSVLYMDNPNKLESIFDTIGGYFFGIYLDYSLKTFTYGDQFTYISGSGSPNAEGLLLYSFSASNVNGAPSLYINGYSSEIFTDFNGERVGINLDYINKKYEFGNYYNINLGGRPKLIVDTNVDTINLNIQGTVTEYNLGLDMDGIVIKSNLSNTSSGISSDYIPVKVNGINYKLALYNI